MVAAFSHDYEVQWDLCEAAAGGYFCQAPPLVPPLVELLAKEDERAPKKERLRNSRSL
jgi:hypothetical protein